MCIKFGRKETLLRDFRGKGKLEGRRVPYSVIRLGVASRSSADRSIQSKFKISKAKETELEKRPKLEKRPI